MEQMTISASQQPVFAHLKHLWERARLPDALLLCGEAGALKERFAKELACLGVCQDKNKPCLHCAACRRVMQEHHTEVSIFKGRGKANSFTVDTVRLIKEQAQVRPLESDVRFLILKDVHEMNQNAQNALLKLLEEPPAHTVLMMTCQNKSALLPTILSRVSAFYLERVDMPFAAGVLKEQFPDKDDGALLEAVELSLGDMELAGSLLNEPKTLALYRHGAQMVKDGVFFSPFACLEGLAVFEKERDAFLHLLPYWAEQMGLIGRRCAQNGVEGRYTAQKCAKLYALFANCRLWLDQNGNLGLLLTWLASQTALL